MSLKDIILVEKYRPQKIDDVVGGFKDRIKAHLKNPSTMPHFIFNSPAPGTGKTALAKAIINELGCDSLILNTGDDRKIEMIREKVKLFIRSKSSISGLKRCVFMDEADSMLAPSQNALKTMLEQYSSNAFFIFSCNRLEAIIKALRSRCITIDFSNPNKQEIYNRLVYICKQENIGFNEKSLKELVMEKYPSIRDMIMILQDVKTTGCSIDEIFTDNYKKYTGAWKLIKTGNFISLKNLLFRREIDPTEFNNFIFREIFREAKNIGTVKAFEILEVVADTEKAFVSGANLDIIFLSNSYKIHRIYKDV